jgi:biotin transport system substrate-specific component
MTIAFPPMVRVPAGERGLTIADFLVPIRVGERMGSRARHVALIVAGALLIALCARIQIQLPDNPVPITAQTFGVLLVGGALGFRRGLLATVLYVIAGFALPVYSGGTSGVAVLGTVTDGRLVLGVRGGYLIGFIVAGAVVGRLAELGWDRRIGAAIAAMVIGNALIYVIGVPWLMVAAHFDVATAITKGLAPFVVTDAVKLVLAAAAFPAAWWVVGRRPGER